MEGKSKPDFIKGGKLPLYPDPSEEKIDERLKELREIS
jgi:hypothetical protein